MVLQKGAGLRGKLAVAGGGGSGRRQEGHPRVPGITPDQEGDELTRRDGEKA